MFVGADGHGVLLYYQIIIEPVDARGDIPNVTTRNRP